MHLVAHTYKGLISSCPQDPGDEVHAIYEHFPDPERHPVCNWGVIYAGETEVVQNTESGAVLPGADWRGFVFRWRALVPDLHRVVYLYNVQHEEPAPCTVLAPSQDELRVQFEELARRWRAETAPLSSVLLIVTHPDYQRIIGMGPRVLPFILRDLERELAHWFWALRAITGEDPVRAEDAGDMEKMRDAWLRLARTRGWL